MFDHMLAYDISLAISQCTDINSFDFFGQGLEIVADFVYALSQHNDQGYIDK